MVGKTNQRIGAEYVYRKLCTQVAETEATIKMLNKMIRCGITTNDEKNFSLKQANLRGVHRETNPRIEKAAMKAKKLDAISHAKRLRRDKFHAKQALIASYMGLNSKVQDRIAKINKNTKVLKKYFIKEKMEKFDHLKQKQCTDPRGDVRIVIVRW